MDRNQSALEIAVGALNSIRALLSPPPLPKSHTGIQHNQTKLTPNYSRKLLPESVRAIKKALALNPLASQRELAEKYGVSDSTINAIKAGKIHKAVR